MGNRIKFKNTFGSQDARLDLQRGDLFKFKIQLPAALNMKWENEVEFAVENFPFPARTKETIPIKYLQQTNHQIGADAATASVAVLVRYAFSTQTAKALESWFWLISNPLTGGVGLTSQVKAKGYFIWMVPNMARQIADLTQTSNSTTEAQDVMKPGLIYALEGVWPSGLKPSDADMKTGNTTVHMEFTLMIDRYYPESLDKMLVTV
jgi:hypothetical protein